MQTIESNPIVREPPEKIIRFRPSDGDRIADKIAEIILAKSELVSDSEHLSLVAELVERD